MKLVSCSSQLGMKFILLIDNEIAKINGNFGLNHKKKIFMLLINGILTIMSSLNFMLS